MQRYSMRLGEKHPRANRQQATKHQMPSGLGVMPPFVNASLATAFWFSTSPRNWCMDTLLYPIHLITV